MVTFFFRTSLLVVPGWMGILVWLVSNAMAETGSGDSRTTIPRWNQFQLCNHCMRRFMSPISLLFHRIYTENAIKFTSEDENVDHSNCHEYSVCWCRLVKKWMDPKEGTSEDDADGVTRKILEGPAESSIIKEGDSRVFDAHRKIQLGALAYQDAGTCPVKEIINAATLLCQIGIFCRMPGKNFSKKAKLSLGNNWCRGSYWSNMFTAKGLKVEGERYQATKTMESEWSLPQGSAVKLDFRGKIIEIDICQVFSEFVEDTENTRENTLKFGSVDSELNNVDYNREDAEEYLPIDFVAKRQVEEVMWLENFVNMEEELVLYNLLNFLSTSDPKLSERKLLVSKFVVANFANACTVNKKLILGLFKMHIKDAAPYLSRESPMSVVCNAGIGGAGRKELAEAKILDFNQDPVSGLEIIPGRELKVKVPGFKTDSEFEKVVQGWDSELYKILTKGWPKELNYVEAGLSENMLEKDKKLPETKKKGPKIKSSFVEPIKILRKVVEKPDLRDENIELRIQSWRCTTCAALTQKCHRHKAPGACFEDNPKPVKNRLRNELKSLCVEAKMKRLAQEEAARQKAEGVSENDNVEVNDNIEKLMDSFNQSMEREDLNEQCNIAGDLYFEVKKAAERKVAKESKTKPDESAQGIESKTNLCETITNSNTVENLESLENPKKTDDVSKEVYEDSKESESVRDGPNEWCMGGVVNGEWVQCRPSCKNCQI